MTRAAMWKKLLRAWRQGPGCQLEMGRQYTSAFPTDAVGWVVLADGLAGVARYREAVNALRRAERLTPPERQWRIALEWGRLYCEKHDEQAAEQWYRKAVAAHPSTSTHIILGGCLAKQGKFAQAKKQHAKATALAKDSAGELRDEAHYNLGLILRAEERYEEAAEQFRQAISLNPAYAIAKRDLRDVENAMRYRKAAEQ